MTDPTTTDISDQLALFACQAVIQQAAEMLAAIPIGDEKAATFEVRGSDEVLCHVTGPMATRDERRSYERWQCCRDVLGGAGAADRLTLVDCIRWLVEQPEPEDDCVTFDQVMGAVLGPL